MDKHELEDLIDTIEYDAAMGIFIEKTIATEKMTYDTFLTLCREYPKLATAYEKGLIDYIWHLSEEMCHGHDTYKIIQNYRKEVESFKNRLTSNDTPN